MNVSSNGLEWQELVLHPSIPNRKPELYPQSFSHYVRFTRAETGRPCNTISSVSGSENLLLFLAVGKDPVDSHENQGNLCVSAERDKVGKTLP